uniref:Uncharacterized protein n=1 Tax=Anopheles quadriannulatus TaxID=34691 RepID=A0A182X7S1_ANOQN
QAKVGPSVAYSRTTVRVPSPAVHPVLLLSSTKSTPNKKMASKRTWESANQQPRSSTARASRVLRAVQTLQIIEDDPAPGTSIADPSESRSLLVAAVKKLQHQSTQTVEPSEVRIKRERSDEPSVPSSPQQQPASKPATTAPSSQPQPATTAPSSQRQQPGSQPARTAQTMRQSSGANRTVARVACLTMASPTSSNQMLQSLLQHLLNPTTATTSVLAGSTDATSSAASATAASGVRPIAGGSQQQAQPAAEPNPTAGTAGDAGYDSDAAFLTRAIYPVLRSCRRPQSRWSSKKLQKILLIALRQELVRCCEKYERIIADVL